MVCATFFATGCGLARAARLAAKQWLIWVGFGWVVSPLAAQVPADTIGTPSSTDSLSEQVSDNAQAPADSLRTFSGMVFDDETDEPLAFVNLIFDSLKTGTNTNLDGAFALQLPPGKHAFRIQEIGYEAIQDTIDLTETDLRAVEIRLPIKSFTTDQVATVRYVNWANFIMKKAIKQKRVNRVADLDAYRYTAYNKLTISFNNISEEVLESNLVLRPAREFMRERQTDSALIDTLNDRLQLTAFISESITEVSIRAPNERKELLRAAQTTGIQSEEANILSSTFTEIDIYDNTVQVLGKQYVSPLASGAFLTYQFAKLDQQFIGPDTVFMIELRPINKFAPAFSGYIWIDSRNYAVRKFDLHPPEGDVGINFVEDVRLRGEFDLINGHYLPRVRDVNIDFVNGAESMGLVGRSVTFMKDYELNPNFPPNHFKGAILEVDPTADLQDSSFWSRNRQSPLERSDQLGYELIDELQQEPEWKFYLTLFELLTTGSKKVGDVYVGPYSGLLGFNPVEGPRTQLGVQTAPSFHPRWYASGFVAYGFWDQRVKYGGELRYKVHVKPRVELIGRYTDGIEQTGFTSYNGNGGSQGLLGSILQRPPTENLNYFQEAFTAVEADLVDGVAARLHLRNKLFEPAFPFQYRNPEDADLPPEEATYGTNYTITEVGAWFRLSFREDYILKRYQKIYIDNEYPKLHVEYSAGLKGVLGGDFAYHHLKLTLSDRLKLGRFGWLTYTGHIGKIWGELPIPSLYNFRGSQSWAMNTIGFSAAAFQSYVGGINTSALYDEVGFNQMFFYEFAADEYLVFGLDHHVGGYFLRKIPLIRRLKFKELWTFRLAWGRLSDANRAINENPDPEAIVQQSVQAPDGNPYVEMGIGVENVLKILRIDYVWRLNYQDPTKPPGFENVNLNQGLRLYLYVGF